ncbi:UDP-N-acetylglucosamine 2-epimerase (non-hydrolyzing) [Bacillus sp. FJAT-42376]|uniref:non-hydrolyzing UDP-N-acetylglucosamine 2-epimerase n=1 Tax=Bacillus sp. FJAT-42376 TaxID=2014076 RepID=UPI000F4FC90F|nr:UDP-N-acetylglucosamine 2-epimerase (non-hydrolyzing) [Bacillus sp. FJAT-42376]AZB43232.1 UDP-N-acetylglucosamine 2-epimerase (non-hydrolyzing) [Bacillus sp. FJAT-42376]
MKVVTILGTRPEIIRLSRIISKLDRLAKKHTVVHTGQNFTEELSGVFFKTLQVRTPDYQLFNQQLTVGEQLSEMFKGLEAIFLKEKPDRILILGDTNSGLSAILAERMGIPVFHMEAGNRCFDLKVPEEKNRKVIDSISSINLPYTEQSRENLLREGLHPGKIHVTGNPIKEVLDHYKEEIIKSPILNQLNLQKKNYLLATIHRSENVDRPERLMEIFKGLNETAEKLNVRVICSIHPRTETRLKQTSLDLHPLVEFYKPFSFFDFVQLEKHAACVLTDSGTVQEECCLFHVPAVTIRDTTERPETVACGSNMLSGIDAKSITFSVEVMMNLPNKWMIPEEYLRENVSDTVVKIILGGKSCV